MAKTTTTNSSITTNSSKTTNDFDYINEGGGSIIRDAAHGLLSNDSYLGTKLVTSVKIGNVTKTFTNDAVNGVVAISGKYGTFYFKADGSYTYTLDESKAALQALAAGQADNEHPVYYTVNNETALTSNLIIKVTGTNDAASITIVSNGDYSVTEDTDYQAGGQLTVSDVDNGEAGFKVLSSLSGDYGSFVFNSDGTWTFTGNNGAATQALGAGKTDTQSLTVSSLDGTATQTITVTVHGVNDDAAIDGDTSGDVTEDGTLAVSGNLTVSDTDNGEAGFSPVDSSALTGAYGDFTFNNGAWTFTGDNGAATQALGAGKTDTQSLTVSSLDGTATKTITVTVHGINDVATFGGTSSGNVTEDGTLNASGSLTVSDADNGETGFKAVDPSTLAGTYGTFTFDSSNGTWGYLLNNTATIVQNLNTGDAPTDTLTVTSLDGTTHDIVVTIHGADEPLGGDTTGGGGTTTTTSTTFTINNGTSFQNGKYHITSYHTGDIIAVSGYSYDGNYKLIDAFGNDGIKDSVSAHFVKTGGKDGSSQTGNGDVDVILDHYMDDFAVVIGSHSWSVDVVI